MKWDEKFALGSIAFFVAMFIAMCAYVYNKKDYYQEECDQVCQSYQECKEYHICDECNPSIFQYSCVDGTKWLRSK